MLEGTTRELIGGPRCGDSVTLKPGLAMQEQYFDAGGGRVHVYASVGFDFRHVAIRNRRGRDYVHP